MPDAAKQPAGKVSDLTQRVFGNLDAGDVEAFMKPFDENCTVIFGNLAPVTGTTALRGLVDQLRSVVKTFHHGVVHEWIAGPDTILELAMVYERHDGRKVDLPCAAVLTVNDKGLVSDWRIFLDPAPLYAEQE
ncbi:nuclear transport factor 2 family protein [Streptomyces liangshanensis]|uniref:Nuclear transport factor 2 family protein n=1 Tax=Streptomyces liangshanensis TaxID=2717324 RepID=A0A6G9GZ04_9ACTN|nr:nuclear transport factor 2 family protein [Streptomyces liangshanensis]QIQ03465.1 nuclear transport factor 2 family protein [Streptomyces liangshanensis]